MKKQSAGMVIWSILLFGAVGGSLVYYHTGRFSDFKADAARLPQEVELALKEKVPIRVEDIYSDTVATKDNAAPFYKTLRKALDCGQSNRQDTAKEARAQPN